MLMLDLCKDFEALRFCRDFEALKFCRDFVAKNWSTFWSRISVKIGKLKFGRDSEGEFLPICDKTCSSFLF